MRPCGRGTNLVPTHDCAADITVLSNFALAGRPDLVQLVLGEDAITTEVVWHELHIGISIGKLPRHDWSWLPILALSENGIVFADTLSPSLGAGEASCLAVAVQRRACVFTDDRDAREIAAQLQIPVSGTFSTLVRLIDLEYLPIGEADRVLTTMIAAGIPLTCESDSTTFVV